MDALATGRAIAERRKAQVIGQAVERLRDQLPGVEVTAERDAILLSGRGLLRRWASDARLRAIGSLIR